MTPLSLTRHHGRCAQYAGLSGPLQLAFFSFPRTKLVIKESDDVTRPTIFSTARFGRRRAIPSFSISLRYSLDLVCAADLDLKACKSRNGSITCLARPGSILMTSIKKASKNLVWVFSL